MSEGPQPAKTVPANVNDTRSDTVDGTSIVHDVASKPATVIAPVKRTLKGITTRIGRRR